MNHPRRHQQRWIKVSQGVFSGWFWWMLSLGSLSTLNHLVPAFVSQVWGWNLFISAGSGRWHYSFLVSLNLSHTLGRSLFIIGNTCFLSETESPVNKCQSLPPNTKAECLRPDRYLGLRSFLAFQERRANMQVCCVSYTH